MLAEERFNRILSIVDLEGSVTVQHLMDVLEISESTVRRDLNTMDANGLLTKVHGGAISKKSIITTKDENVLKRKSINLDDKTIIAKYAASLVTSNDFVYIDASTTTELIIDYLDAPGAVFVTNSLTNANKLSSKGYQVYILGGEFKSTTEAIVGEEAVVTLDKYNFTKGFWGTNGVHVDNGYTTPEIKEAMVKRKSMQNCKDKFVLADVSKFSQISSVKFADFSQAIVITTNIKDMSFAKCDNVINADEMMKSKEEI